MQAGVKRVPLNLNPEFVSFHPFIVLLHICRCSFGCPRAVLSSVLTPCPFLPLRTAVVSATLNGESGPQVDGVWQAPERRVQRGASPPL